MALSLLQKLEILADAAKYDASCASSGGARRNARNGGIGSTTGAGICHAYTPDGRCVSLLKILMTNFCMYDCAYCVSRRSSNVPRARFTVEEVVTLTLDLYRRNCIEGLFLSSGIARSEDDTMADMVRIARSLREDHRFHGYLHLKTIPGASDDLIAAAGRYADRLSMNVELPDERALTELAPEKNAQSIRKGMAATRLRIDEAKDARAHSRNNASLRSARPPRFAPAGQSTQMIVGADNTSDLTILDRSVSLVAAYRLKRIYYSAFSPTGHPSSRLPDRPTPLAREHRLYQADWLLRFYEFSLADVAAGLDNEMLDLSIDPKMAWALKHRGIFPLDVNRADRSLLLRVPGLGVKAVDRIIQSRRTGALRLSDVGRITGALRRALPFIVTADHHPGNSLDAAALRQQLLPKPTQLSLF